MRIYQEVRQRGLRTAISGSDKLMWLSITAALKHFTSWVDFLGATTGSVVVLESAEPELEPEPWLLPGSGGFGLCVISGAWTWNRGRVSANYQLTIPVTRVWSFVRQICYQDGSLDNKGWVRCIESE